MEEKKTYRHVAMYLRKSRKDIELEEGGEEDTLARHRKALFEVAKEMKLPIEHVYEEVVSGDTIAARKQMQLLLTAIENGLYDAVLCYDIDRLGRGDMRDQGLLLETFKWNNCDIITPEKVWVLAESDDPTKQINPDEELWEVKAWGARIEYRMIKKRLAKGRLQSEQSGLFIGHTPPYGYRREKRQGQKGWILVPDEPKASVVRDIYRWYLGEGGEPKIGISLIVRKLNERGIPGPAGKDWVPCTVRSILGNQEYAGFIRRGYRREIKSIKDGAAVISRPRSTGYALFPGLHEPIITADQSKKAIELLSRNKSRPGPKQVKTQNPLAGLVYCSLCGRAMIRRPYTSGRPDSLMCIYTSCKCVSSDLDTIEEMILEGLRNWIKEAEVDYSDIANDSMQQELDSLDQTIADAEKEKKKYDQQISRAYELVETSVYSIEVFQQRMKSLTVDIENVEAKIAALIADKKRIQASITARSKLIPNVRTVLEAYQNAENAGAKNLLLKTVLARVDYYKTNRKRWGNGSDLQLTLHPLYEELD